MERYTKIRNVGKGNMGQVVLVRSNEDNKLYVMKLIDLSKMNKKERTASLNEAKVLSALSHLNVINYVDSFLSRKTEHLCIVMEFAEGGDLSNRVKQAKGRHFSEEQILDWFIQICLGLQYCHKKHVLHRDIKSQNIFLTDEGVIKVGDFGISRVLANTCDCAHTFVGTPYYLSPELVQERPYNNMSDCWALGVVLYELMALKHPFNATDMKGLMYKILRVIYDPPPLIYSSELRAIVTKLLQKDPNKRPKVSQILEFPIIKRRIAKLIAGTPDANMPAAYLNQLIEGGLIEGVSHVAGEPETDSESSSEENVRRLVNADVIRNPLLKRDVNPPPPFTKIPKPFSDKDQYGVPAPKPLKPLYPRNPEPQEAKPSRLPPIMAKPNMGEPASVIPDIPAMPDQMAPDFGKQPTKPLYFRSPAIPPPPPLDMRPPVVPNATPNVTRFSAYSHFYEARRQAELNRLKNAQHKLGIPNVNPPPPASNAPHNRAWRF